jgi:hypothetical protein
MCSRAMNTGLLAGIGAKRSMRDCARAGTSCHWNIHAVEPRRSSYRRPGDAFCNEKAGGGREAASLLAGGRIPAWGEERERRNDEKQSWNYVQVVLACD